MANQFGSEKVHLEQALALLGEIGPISYSVAVAAIADRFSCQQRAAADAFHVLREGRYLERAKLPAPGGDRRLRYYRIGERGRYLLTHPDGPHVLRIARQLFTSCPSDWVRWFQERATAQHGSPHLALEAHERRLLISPAELKRRTEQFHKQFKLANHWSPLAAARAMLTTPRAD
jgi:hypothetical protein